MASGDSGERRVRGWLLQIILVLGTLFLIVFLEFGLRTADYGFTPSAVVTEEIDGKPTCCDNPKFGWLFFPREIARWPDPYVFPVTKPDNTVRIFVLGGSAAKGEPDAAFSFGRLLCAMLRHAYPGVEFEVHNTAMTAINSHVVRVIAEDCAEYQPDLLIVYMGNNEVVGPYGAGTVFSAPSLSLPLSRAVTFLRGTRVGQLTSNVIVSIRGRTEGSPRIWRGMEMFLENRIRSASPELETVYRNLEANLEDIIGSAMASGAGIIVSTVPVNLKDCPPFASLHRSGMTPEEKDEWEVSYREGVKAEEAAEFSSAMIAYEHATAIDAEYADLHFRLARCWESMGVQDKAGGEYAKALELDALRFRADERINRILRDSARGRQEDGVHLVDAVSAFHGEDRDVAPGEELFYDHVHLNFHGDYLLARTIFDTVVEALPQWVRERRDESRAVLSEEECARALAYTGWDELNQRLRMLNGFIKRPPFTQQLFHEEEVTRLEREIAERRVYRDAEEVAKVLRRHHQAIEANPTDWWLHWKLAEFNLKVRVDRRSAAQEYRSVLRLVPHHFMADVRLGYIAGLSGNFYECEMRSLAALDIMPTCADAHYNLGVVYERKGKLDKAAKSYRAVLDLQPNHIDACKKLAQIQKMRGDFAAAVATFRRALEVTPDSADLHYHLAVLLRSGGRASESISEFRAALRSDPTHEEAREALQDMLKKEDDR